MENKPLKETNPFLKKTSLYNEMLIVNVASSAMVEIGKLPLTLLNALRGDTFPSLISPLSEK